MKLKILTIPEYETILRQTSKEINPTDISNPDMQKFFDALTSKMFNADGAGLAAPQVNRKIRVIAVNMGHDESEIFINPTITKKSFFKDTAEEGCLSIPGIYGQVKRHKHLTLKYLNRDGRLQTHEFSGIVARIIQHEIDHLDGILFIDKMIKQN